MSPLADPPPSRFEVLPQPLLALEASAQDFHTTSSEAKSIEEMLASLLNDESALYAITREWRYDAASRKFLRLKALLDEQFSEAGSHLTRLAPKTRDRDSGSPTLHSERLPVADEALQAHMIRELIRLHEAVVSNLKRATSRSISDQDTRDLLADLKANHEKDAFMLRALLWEVENVAP